MGDRVIYKYPFEEATIRQGIDYIDAPSGKVVLVAQQGAGRLPTLWVEHASPVLTMHSDRYRIAGTGHPIGAEFADWDHVGSCVCGSLVWYVYRKENTMNKGDWRPIAELEDNMGVRDGMSRARSSPGHGDMGG